MTRETKAQREAREDAERQAAWEKFREEYPQRFAKVLYEFTRLAALGVRCNDEHYEVSPLGVAFSFRKGYTNELLNATAPVNQEWDLKWSLDRLDRDVQHYYDEQAEWQRKADVKREALAKLNAEERELLGL